MTKTENQEWRIATIEMENTVFDDVGQRHRNEESKATEEDTTSDNRNFKPQQKKKKQIAKNLKC